MNAEQLMGVSIGMAVQACPNSHQVPDGCYASVSLHTGLNLCLHSYIATPTVTQKTVLSDQPNIHYLL